MTYEAQETSAQDGAPVELYVFRRGATVIGRYTSADVDYSLDGDTYASTALERGPIEATGETARTNLDIDVPRDNPIALLFRVTPPSQVIALVVMRVHRTDGAQETAVIWAGRLLNVENAGVRATLHCEPIESSLARPGLRRPYSLGCPLLLFTQGDGLCNAVRATHASVTTVTAISGITLGVASLATKPWRGGFVEWDSGGGMLERRYINAVAGASLTLLQAFQGIEIGDAVTVVPACDGTRATCDGVYGNILNYGGYPFIPTKNPFDGNPVY